MVCGAELRLAELLVAELLCCTCCALLCGASQCLTQCGSHVVLRAAALLQSLAALRIAALCVPLLHVSAMVQS